MPLTATGDAPRPSSRPFGRREPSRWDHFGEAELQVLLDGLNQMRDVQDRLTQVRHYLVKQLEDYRAESGPSGVEPV